VSHDADNREYDDLQRTDTTATLRGATPHAA
jgi:hypothetical protein